MTARTLRDDVRARRHVAEEFKKTGVTERRGTKITFKPDSQIFETLVFPTRRWPSACANSPSSTRASRSRYATSARKRSSESVYHYEGGIVEFVQHLNRARTALHDAVYIEGESREYTSSRSGCSGTIRTTSNFTRSPTRSTRSRAAHTWRVSARH